MKMLTGLPLGFKIPRAVQVFFLLTLLISKSGFALEVPPLTGPVEDLAGLLNPTEKLELGRRIVRGKEKGIAQVQVLIVPTLAGDSIEDFSIRVVDQWKLGDATADHGILLLIAVQDRAVRIEVGHGLEGRVTDLISGRIIRNTIVPSFRQQRYSEGIDAAVDQILTYAAADGPLVVVKDPKFRNFFMLLAAALAFFVFIIFMRLYLFIQMVKQFGFWKALLISRAQSRRSSLGSGSISTGTSSGFGSSGSFGGSSGGFGSWSGGGGSFGGGGASGRW